MNPHNWITALDPPLAVERRWRCEHCGEAGSFDDLMGPDQKNPCPFVYPPCASCGQTPECSPDCKGVAEALASPGVRVAP